ncbi:MAG: large-conductance mechanosensitive channel protein MscL [Bacteroidetes bacterium]|nr:large-conductance mechanosensitive channel protein MscL [Bacteroidota bacterium]
MSFMKEFKAFAMRGNVIDMAVGIVIGAAFGKIVSSFVGDVLMPPIGLLVGNIDFSEIAIVLRQANGDIPSVSMNLGVFINTLIDFIIVAFAIFLVIKGMNKMQKKEEAKPAPPPAPSKEEVLLTEIRDLLKK